MLHCPKYVYICRDIYVGTYIQLTYIPDDQVYECSSSTKEISSYDTVHRKRTLPKNWLHLSSDIVKNGEQ